MLSEVTYFRILIFKLFEMDKLYIGIRAEDKSYWERRTPIPPHDCKYIMEKVIRIPMKLASKNLNSSIAFQ